MDTQTFAGAMISSFSQAVGLSCCSNLNELRHGRAPTCRLNHNDCGSSLWRVAGSESSCLMGVRCGLALPALDILSDIHNPRGGSVVFLRTKRKATLLGDIAGRSIGCRLLDWTVISFGNLLSKFCEV